MFIVMNLVLKMSLMKDYRRRCDRMGRSRAMKPTRNQKALMSKAGLAVNNWLVLEETKTELRLVSRGAGVRRTIKKSLTNAN